MLGWSLTGVRRWDVPSIVTLGVYGIASAYI
jgi:hypothetical protein